MSCFIDFLDKWQTLISGFLAVGAAAVGTYFLRKQIAQSELHERTRLRARLASARAVLPLALDQIANYATQQIGALAELHENCRLWTLEAPKPSLRKVELPSDVIFLLREAIEAADANRLPKALELLSDIIAEIQVLNARIEGAEERLAKSGPSGLTLELEEHIVLAAKLYGLAVGLLPFARRADGDGPIAVSWNDARNRLITSRVEIPGVNQILDRKLLAATTIWVAKGEEA